MSVLYSNHLISKTMLDFSIYSSFQWMEQDMKGQNYKDFDVNCIIKKISGFNGLINVSMLYHLVLLATV